MKRNDVLVSIREAATSHVPISPVWCLSDRADAVPRRRREIMTRDPIAKLMEDHRVFLRKVRSFRAHLSRGAAEVDSALPAARRVSEFASFLRRDVDQIHGQQEERGLFPVLGRHLPMPGGPISVMVSEHEALRGFQAELARSAHALESGPSANETSRTVALASESVEELLVSHVFKEDSVLFPMAYEVLSTRELDEIAQVFEEVEAKEGMIVVRSEPVSSTASER